MQGPPLYREGINLEQNRPPPGSGGETLKGIHANLPNFTREALSEIKNLRE